MSGQDFAADWEPLLWGMFDGTLTTAGRDQLDQLLQTNSQARRDYLDLVEVHTVLRRQLGQVDEIACLPVEADNELAPTPEHHGRGFMGTLWDVANTYLALSLLLSGLVITIFLLSLALIVPDWQPNVPTPNVPSTEFVARITNTAGATFDKTSDGNFQNRDLFDDDKIVLNSGLAVIEYDTGARVVLEGPATYHVDGANGGDLRLGKLIARVEAEAAQGFAVQVPGARIVDLGTEFAAEVTPAGNATVGVLQGSVEVVADGDASSPLRKIRLKANQAASIDAAGNIARDEETDVASFAKLRNQASQADAKSLITQLDPGLRVMRFAKGAPRVADNIQYRVTEVPSDLEGLSAIVPPRGRGLREPGAGYRFRVSEPVRLYLLVHQRGNVELNDWERSDFTVTWNVAGQTFEDVVFTRRAEAGEVRIPAHEGQNKKKEFGLPHACLVSQISE